jgi:NADH:ubiquinone oxidoreductase subunit 3 (subunit A)
LQPAGSRDDVPRGLDGVFHGIVWLVLQPVLVFLLLLAVSSRPLGSRASWFWLVLMIPPCLGVLYSWRKLNRLVSHSNDR